MADLAALAIRLCAAFIPLTQHINVSKQEYYRLLLGVTRAAAWEPWILYMVRAVQETANWTLAKIEAIRGLAAQTAEFMRAKLPKIYSRELVDAISSSPTAAFKTWWRLGSPSARRLRFI